jgi:hypothetical protein
MPGRPHPLTAPPDGAHTPSMLQRVIDHQRQPKQLLKLPFGVVTIAAAAYVFMNGGTGQDSRDAGILIGVMMIILIVIDVAWWVTHRQRANP